MYSIAQNYLTSLLVVIVGFLTLSCGERKATEFLDKNEKVEEVDPRLSEAIQFRAEVIELLNNTVRTGEVLNEDIYLKGWSDLDVESKESNLKAWSCTMGLTMGFDQGEVIDFANETNSPEKIEETWNEFVEWRLSELRKRVEEFHEEFSSTEDQKYIKQLPDYLIDSEGPYIVEGDRAYNLLTLTTYADDSKSLYTTSVIRYFDEYRKQNDGSWRRVDWTSWGESLKLLGTEFKFSYPLETSHISEEELISMGPSFNKALNIWKNLTERPSEINPEAFVDHCYPELLEECKSLIIEWLENSNVVGSRGRYEHLFLWAGFFEKQVEKMDVTKFWLAYMEYCRGHIRGDYFDEYDSYEYSDLAILIEPSKGEYSRFERYLFEGDRSNFFVRRLLKQQEIQIYDLVVINENEVDVIYRINHGGSMFGGLFRERFSCIDGNWKFRDNEIKQFFELPVLMQREELAEMKNKLESEK